MKKSVVVFLAIFILCNFSDASLIPNEPEINSFKDSSDNLDENCFDLIDNSSIVLRDISDYLEFNFSDIESQELKDIIEKEVFPKYPELKVCNLQEYIKLLTDKLDLNNKTNNTFSLENKVYEKLNNYSLNNLDDFEINTQKEDIVIKESNNIPILENNLVLKTNALSNQYVYDTAEYLHGKTYAIVIFVDSPSYKWDTNTKSSVLNKVSYMGSWLDTYAPNSAGTSFDSGHYSTSVSIDPTKCNDNVCKCITWMNEAVNNLGFYDTHNEGYSVDELNDYIKSVTNSKNVYPLFVIKNNELSSKYVSYACGGSYIPRVVIYYYNTCTLGLCTHVGKSTYIHEALHEFGADDEYAGPWTCDGVEDCTRKVNEWDYTNGNCDYCSGSINAIMKGSKLNPLIEYYNPSYYTQGQIGWGDHDGDLVLDPVDNCMYFYNPPQQDTDNDQIGDVCDSDKDGDSILNQKDVCPEIYGTYCHGCPIPTCPSGYLPNCPISGFPICKCLQNITNTTWSNWQNISCLLNNKMNQSRFFIQYDSNSCPKSQNKTITEYQSVLPCEILDNNQTDDSIYLMVYSPKHKSYNERRVPFEINVSEIVDKIVYIDNSNSKLREISLCTKNCQEYGLYRLITQSFSDGDHNVLFKIIKNNTVVDEQVIELFVDSTEPRISNIKPASRKYTNGSDFYIKYTEDNCQNLIILINGQEIYSDSCESGKNIEKVIPLNISRFNGQEVEYKFIIIDIANNTKESRATKVKVDTTAPEIKNLTASVVGRYVYFNMIILNEERYSFSRVEYFDSYDETRAIWKSLCTGLKNNICYKKVLFRNGTQDSFIRVVDNAGNSVEQKLEQITIG